MIDRYIAQPIPGTSVIKWAERKAVRDRIVTCVYAVAAVVLTISAFCFELPVFARLVIVFVVWPSVGLCVYCDWQVWRSLRDLKELSVKSRVVI